MKLVESLASAFLGTRRARRSLAAARAANPGIISGIAELERASLAPADDSAPIFLLSAGWRSGSTLLQRLIMSDREVLLWGEPYDECGPIQAMAQTVRGFRPGWPPAEYFYAGSKPRSEQWVANLFPALTDLREGHRAFFEATFARPARAAGASRWGIKEVRLTAQHAHYLRWVYPNAKFVFLYRHPLEAYRSYSGQGRDWFDTWPERPVFTPAAFGRHWRSLAEGFLREEKALNALVVRYEELVSGNGELLERIEDHLAVRLERSILAAKVGASSERGGERVHVSAVEQALLRHAVEPLAAALGYRW